MKYMILPDITTYEGVVVTKDLVLDFEYGNLTQTVKDLKLTTKQTIKTDKWTRKQTTVVNLVAGEILIKDPTMGYLLPEIGIDTVENVIKDLEAIKE